MKIIFRHPQGTETEVEWDAVPRVDDTVAFSETDAYVVDEVEWNVQSARVYVYLAEGDV